MFMKRFACFTWAVVAIVTSAPVLAQVQAVDRTGVGAQREDRGGHDLLLGL